MDLAAVLTDLALAEQLVVGRHGLHLGHHGGAVGIALELMHGLQVVHARPSRRPPAPWSACCPCWPARTPWRTRGCCRCRSQYQASVMIRPCAVFRPSACTSVMKTSRPARFWPPCDDAELGRLLDGVGRVGAGVGEADDLGLGLLGLQQERGEVLRREGMAHLAHHLAAVLLDHGRGVGLQRVAEGVVGGQEEPGIAARLDDRLAGAVGERPGVIGPVHRVGACSPCRSGWTPRRPTPGTPCSSPW